MVKNAVQVTQMYIERIQAGRRRHLKVKKTVYKSQRSLSDKALDLTIASMSKVTRR